MAEEFTIELESGHEWHSKPIRLDAGDVVTVSATSENRFFAGLFDREEYFRRRRAIAGAFDFLPGSDRPQFTLKFQVPETEDYYLVFRVSVFRSNQKINVRWIVESPKWEMSGGGGGPKTPILGEAPATKPGRIRRGVARLSSGRSKAREFALSEAAVFAVVLGLVIVAVIVTVGFTICGWPRALIPLYGADAEMLIAAGAFYVVAFEWDRRRREPATCPATRGAAATPVSMKEVTDRGKIDPAGEKQ
jgi:hypothetical protein